jgi:hypothetical protein
MAKATAATDAKQNNGPNLAIPRRMGVSSVFPFPCPLPAPSGAACGTLRTPVRQSGRGLVAATCGVGVGMSSSAIWRGS